MTKVCLVNYEGKEERDRLIEFLEKEGFEPGVIYTPTGDRYGFVIDFNKKEYWSRSPAMMACIVSAFYQISVDEFMFCYEYVKKEDRRQFIVHIPHAGEEFPKEIKLDVDENEKCRQHEAMKDDYLEDIVPKYYDHLIKFDISRIVCDVERFLENEPMEKYGMGFCYKKGYNGKTIRWENEDCVYSPDKELKYYKQHHGKFTEICKKSKKLFILDLHSYQKKIIPGDMIRRDRNLPDVCLGFDEKFMRPEIAEFAAKKFLEMGLSVAFNYPYSGSFVPKEVLDSPDEYDCLSLMVELNRNIFEYGREDLWRSVREIPDSIMFYAMQNCE